MDTYSQSFNKNENIGWNFYLLLVTILSIGYGDQAPTIQESRGLVILAAFLGIYSLAVGVRVITDLMHLTESEYRMVTYI